MKSYRLYELIMFIPQADIVKQNEKHAKTKALVDMVKQNKNATSLDLHNLSVRLGHFTFPE